MNPYEASLMYITVIAAAGFLITTTALVFTHFGKKQKLKAETEVRIAQIEAENKLAIERMYMEDRKNQVNPVTSPVDEGLDNRRVRERI